ncbi:MAG: cytochrome-c oxidase, cbb3-type subunit III [Hyphomonas sp.]|nr:cytochrome-c oxidase, cbb3-type subunit III [Hyphomonas sp.]MCB9971581.1 cytochrome-c oxidase, cbb3-type subunit III [Hyphomonas sp.]
MSESKKEVDVHSGVETTGHVWDGIKELNTPLPRWWLYIFYITIVWAIGYMIAMPAIPALPGLGTHNTTGVLGMSDRHTVEQKVAELHAERAAESTKLLDASLEDIETDLNLQQFAMAMGESAFGDNCATCHGAGGRGAKGYPTLADDVWLWDGTLEGIEQTIRHGIRSADDADTRFSAMPAFGRDGLLTSDQIDDLVQYVLSISGHEADAAAAARGGVTFQAQCSSCHGVDGHGTRALGAPNLTDADWLYVTEDEWRNGTAPDEIRGVITNARNSHMPAWNGRLDDATIKALAVYVHSLGGGE